MEHGDAEGAIEVHLEITIYSEGWRVAWLDRAEVNQRLRPRTREARATATASTTRTTLLYSNGTGRLGEKK